VQGEIGVSEIDPQEFGRLQATVDALESDMSEMKADVRIIRDAITEARGGWKLLLLIGGAAATVGAAVSWVIEHVNLK
jgi:hypothetical protein